ncbi:hypothetical protein PHMEG_00018993 [Phytophthora megakarya]|uniref:DDE Tnp4 domain-containing protein n=1 Tax=Phytophthora megakarya TaxID=4795 RepID=A0A225VSE3_9STRA|nr:hypothetical protein PHMEG_00018993 [Phytophthora megakarya]
MLWNMKSTSTSDYTTRKCYRLVMLFDQQVPETPAFDAILELIHDDPVFKPGRRAFRGGPELHLLVLLKYLGAFGNDNPAPKVSYAQLKDTTMAWPDEDERTQISRGYGFVNCVDMIDGTLLPLEFKPFKKGGDYYSRKGRYSLNALIMCDDVARVRDAVVGWPGCVHDNDGWSNSRVCQEPGRFFDPNLYILGDSAFQPSPTMVPAFKKPPKSEFDHQLMYLYTRLAQTRFQFLRGIKIKLRRKASMRRLLRLTTCAFILHNLLIANPIPEAWKRYIKMFGKLLDDDDELNHLISRLAGGTERRFQLFYHLLEIRW